MRCEEKRRYETKGDAKAASRKGRQFGRTWGRPYRCPECGTWHLTTVDAESRARIRERVRKGGD